MHYRSWKIEWLLFMLNSCAGSVEVFRRFKVIDTQNSWHSCSLVDAEIVRSPVPDVVIVSLLCPSLQECLCWRGVSLQ